LASSDAAESTLTDEGPAPRDAVRGIGPVSGSALRVGTWVFSGVVLAGFAGLVLLPIPDGLGYAIGQWLFTVVVACATTGALMAARWTGGLERRFWSVLALAAGLIVLSQAYYAWFVSTIDVAGPPIPSISSWLDIAAILVFIALMTSLARFRHASVLSRIRYVVDEVAVTFIALVAVYALIVAPWYGALGVQTAGPRIIAAVYPVLGVHLLVGTLRFVVGVGASRWRSWERLLVFGLAGLSLGLIMWPLWYASAFHGFGGPLAAAPNEALWLGGSLFILAASVYRHTEWESRWNLAPMPTIEPTSGWLAAVALPTVELLAIPVFGWMAYAAAPSPASVRMYTTVTVVTVALVVVRTALTVVDNGHLFNSSVTDPLTGLFNHRYFHERLAAAVSTAERFGEEVSVAVIDLDDFSGVNSVAGHAVGDGVLADVALCIRGAAREADIVCRLGGDEFGVILPGTAPDAAVAVCQRIGAALRRAHSGYGRSVTASIGVAGYPLHATDRDEILRMADGAQYWAKYHGKNQVVLYDAETVTALDAAERIRGLQDTMHLNTVRSLAAAVDARSPGMEHHSRNVAALAVLLARELGLDERKATLLEVAALVHDVGKIGVPDRVLNKRGRLTPAESAIIQDHCVLGERVLQSTKLVEVLPWVRHHHERWDGAGYPDGLAGEEIPLEARILCVCDTYDAMTSERTSRSAMSKSAALQEIDLGLGSQFDPAVGEVFLRMAAGRRVL